MGFLNSPIPRALSINSGRRVKNYKIGLRRRRERGWKGKRVRNIGGLIIL
jgi:hypothetical protein